MEIPTSTIQPTHHPTPSAGPLKAVLQQTTTEMSREFSTLITNAFALMAALAWSEFVKTLFEKHGPLSKMPVAGPLAFACLATCIAFIVATTIGRMKKPECTKLCKE